MADHSVVVVVDDDDESKIVTKFLLSTCRLRQPSLHHVQAAAACSIMARGTKVGEFHFMPRVTGSSAEFYIQPMLPFVGDVDIMLQQSDMLAIPEGCLPPTELPAEFYSRVEVYEMIPSKFPGYVYLPLSYVLTEDSDASKYSALRYRPKQRYYALNRILDKRDTTRETHGPAVTAHDTESKLSFDRVPCLPCLSWPSQAADWPTRHRNYDWPDSTTVDCIVDNGCDVVYVAHRLCREDEWISNYQWRLSFSRAEIVLLNSWMPVQQVVYHMLRYFVKNNERLTDITDSTGTKIICNYHLKTLMMWACERKPQSWWIDDVNVVRICVKLFHVLADWLNNKIYPHYFVNKCNLLYNAEHLEIIASQLSSITESWLSTWFVNNYLRKCAQLCPDRVSRLFDDVSTSMELQNAVSAVVDWRRNNALDDLWWVCDKAVYTLPFFLYMYSVTVVSCRVCFNELAKIDSCLRDYFTAVALLHVANRIAKHSFNDELLDVLATLVGQFVGKRRYCHQLSSELSLSQAVILMKVVSNNSYSTVQQIYFELSKVYLHRALRCKDSDSDSIYCLANVYLAVWYYTSGQYQTAIDHCTLVMRSQDHSQCTSHVVQGDLLPKVDNDIDTVLGLAVFYQYVRTAALKQQQTQYVVVFTTELFAHYLYIRCLSVMKCRQSTQMSSTDVVQRHTKCIVGMDQLFIADVLLLRSIITSSDLKCHYKTAEEQCHSSTTNATELQDTSELVELLQQSAVKHLTTFRQLQEQRFGSIATIFTTDFEALYAYKHGDYQRCLQLSTQNLRALLYAALLPDVPTHPQFIQLLDDDIVSLTALTLIVNPKCRDYACIVGIGQLTLLLYLMTQCQLKLHHSVTSLAQTLDYIKDIHRSCPVSLPLDRLTLKLLERKVTIYLSEIMHCVVM